MITLFIPVEHRITVPPLSVKNGWYVGTFQSKAHYIKDGYPVCCGDYLLNDHFKPYTYSPELHLRGKCLFCVHALHFFNCYKCTHGTICKEGLELRYQVEQKENSDSQNKSIAHKGKLK